MKKLLIALMLISLIFCVSCTQTGGETTTQQGIGEETTLQANNSAYGDFVNDINTFDQITLNENITIDDDLRQSLPIFVDKYPESSSGPEYEITQDVIDMLYADYYAYLDLAGIERDAIRKMQGYNSIQTIDLDMPHIVVIPNKLSVSMESDLININSSVDEIKSFMLNNTYFSALCKFMKISNPDISIRYINKMGKRNAEVIITEKSDDISTNIVNSSLHRIRVSISEDNSEIYCYGLHVDMSETVNAPVISYSSALSSYKLENKGDILGCEVIYKPDICLGYYIPCYVFYSTEQTDTQQKDNAKVKKTIVPMYDITAIEKTVSAD